MKKLFKILGIIIIDFVLIWLWVYQIDPDPSISIGIIVLVPFVFVVNLILAGILYLLKESEYSRLFLINSLVASFLMYYLFVEGIDRHQNKRLESWEFSAADTTFSLTRWKNTNSFSLTYSLEIGSSWGFMDGDCELKNTEWILKADSIEMKISDNKLIGFRNQNDTIRMKKIKR